MKKRYCKMEMELSEEYEDFLLSSPGITLLTEDGQEENAVSDIFSGWWM